MVGAVLANLLIAGSKFVAAAMSSSVAMFAEGIHSVVDAGNGMLLLLGLHLARKAPDEMHPFGHGKEIYFWALVVAMMIFGVGGGVSIAEGIVHVVHPTEIEDATATYVVLGAAALFEGGSLAVALREFLAYRRRELPGYGLLTAIRASKDPTTFSVILEDSAALAGIAVAFLGVSAGRAFDAPYLDGAASIVIGMILATVALFLGSETRGLIVGERAWPRVTSRIRALATADPDVERVGALLTMHLGPDDVLLAIHLRFRPGMTAAELGAALRRIDRAVRAEHPRVRHVFIDIGALAGGV